jgi:hypothetical protein
VATTADPRRRDYSKPDFFNGIAPKGTFREAATPAWPDIDMRRACGSANRDAPLRMSRIPERVDGARQTCDGSAFDKLAAGENENVDPDHIGGTGSIGRCLIPLLAKRSEEIACMDINPQTADFSEYGKQVRLMRSTMS